MNGLGLLHDRYSARIPKSLKFSFAGFCSGIVEIMLRGSIRLDKLRIQQGKGMESVDLSHHVRLSILESPQRSAPKHLLDLPIRSVRRILHSDLHYQTYKLAIVHELSTNTILILGETHVRQFLKTFL